MFLLPVLRAHVALRTEAPPEIWEADSTEADFLPLLREMLARAAGTPPDSLTLGIANVAVGPDPDPDEGTSVPVGEYVAVTLLGPGHWSSDWRWLPTSPDTTPLAIPPACLRSAQVRFAYGRHLSTASSLTVFLARRHPPSLPRPA